MILPFLNGILFFKKAPITWLLIILNACLFMYTETYQVQTKKELEKYYERETLVRAQGEIFAEFVSHHPEHYSDFLIKLSELALAGNRDHLELLGRLALRDYDFIKSAEKMEFGGDAVLFEFWQEQFSKVKDVVARDPVTIWGLGHRDQGPLKWLTYQFLHGGNWHLFINMVFLLIYGSALEPLLGSLLFLGLYLLSGFAAAGAYIGMSGLSGVPLVGASGSISGLMGMVVAYFWRERVRFLSWLLPVRGYTGIVYLPAWVLLFYWGTLDLAGYVATLQEIGGVAHAAHLGGIAFGLVAGCVFRIWSKPAPHGVLGHAPGL